MKWLSLSLSISLFFSLSRHIDLHSNCASHSDLIVNFILLPLHNSYREEGRKHFREKLSWLSSFFLLIYGFSLFLYFVRFFYFISQHKNVPKVWMRLLIFHPLPSRAIHFGGEFKYLAEIKRTVPKWRSIRPSQLCKFGYSQHAHLLRANRFFFLTHHPFLSVSFLSRRLSSSFPIFCSFPRRLSESTT